METKLIEIRDRMTCIPALAIRLMGRGDAEQWLIRRAGYDRETATGMSDGIELRCPECGYTVGGGWAEELLRDNPQGLKCPSGKHRGPYNLPVFQSLPGSKEYCGPPTILLMKLDGDRVQHDPFGWGDRTYSVTHQFLVERWQHIRSGEVIDVEFILGETAKPKESERVTHV